jgi:hypothetical protein
MAARLKTWLKGLSCSSPRTNPHEPTVKSDFSEVSVYDILQYHSFLSTNANPELSCVPIAYEYNYIGFDTESVVIILCYHSESQKPFLIHLRNTSMITSGPCSHSTTLKISSFPLNGHIDIKYQSVSDSHYSVQYHSPPVFKEVYYYYRATDYKGSVTDEDLQENYSVLLDFVPESNLKEIAEFLVRIQSRYSECERTVENLLPVLQQFPIPLFAGLPSRQAKSARKTTQ